ncbi:MAG: hypothetical protein WB036_17260 [Pseudolabrys sp.]
MRRLLIALAVVLLPSFAIAHGHGGGHGGMGGTGGGRMAGGWSAHAASIAGGARMRAWNGHMAAWNGRAGNWTRFHHGHFVHRHGRVFFVGGPWWGGYGYYDYGCWQWVPTRWGPQRIWVCGSYY